MFNIVTVQSSSKTVIGFYQDNLQNSAGHILGSNSKATETLFVTDITSSTDTLSVIFSLTLLKTLLTETGPILAPGVEPQLVSVESISKTPAPIVLNAITTYFFSHPEHLETLINALSTNPPQVLES